MFANDLFGDIDLYLFNLSTFIGDLRGEHMFAKDLDTLRGDSTNDL